MVLLRQVVFALLEFLKTGHPEIQQQCALTVTRLATDQTCREKLIQHGAVKVGWSIPMCASPVAESSASPIAESALIQLPFGLADGCGLGMSWTRPMQAVLEMSLRPSSNIDTCRACAAALRTFVMDREIARRVVDGGGIKALVNLIKHVRTRRQTCPPPLPSCTPVVPT